MQPLFDRILVQRAKAASKTANGIYLPEKNLPKLSQGTVISAGPGVAGPDGKVVPTSVKPGDEILIPSFGGQSVKVGEEEYFIFRDHEILAKIAKE